MSSVLTSANWVAQQTYYFCGPAAAQMVLQSAGAAWVDQSVLWQEVMDASTGTQHAGIGWLPQFSNQHCQKCGKVWRCWFSAPAALRTVINGRVPGDPLTLVKAANSRKQSTVARMIKNVNAGVAPTFLTGGDHWKVVWGYEFGSASAALPATNLAGVDVTAFYVHDPDPDMAEMSLVLQSVSTFMSDFATIGCGPAVSGKLVAIMA